MFVCGKALGSRIILLLDNLVAVYLNLTNPGPDFLDNMYFLIEFYWC